MRKSQQQLSCAENVIFHRGFLRGKKKSDIPPQHVKGIQTLSIKTITFYKAETNFSKRRSSSVLKSLTVLVSHVRAATYVLVIVSVYFVTQTPYFVYCVYKSLITSQNVIANSNSENSDINLIVLKRCLIDALENKTCYVETKNVLELNSFIQSSFDSEEIKTMLRLLGIYLPLLNSMANPVLYALWYPNFRKYMFKTLYWIKMKIWTSTK
jgi:hypothetical protein